MKRRAIDWISMLTNLGVIAGLVLVAYEVRQATLQAEAAASQVVATEYADARREMALSPDLAEIFVKANTNGVGALTPVEKFRIRKWEEARRARMIGQFKQYQLGFLDRGTIEALIRGTADLEKGLWADLELSPIGGEFGDEMEAIREEMRLRNQ